jgi:hypothetical protein
VSPSLRQMLEERTSIMNLKDANKLTQIKCKYL